MLRSLSCLCWIAVLLTSAAAAGGETNRGEKKRSYASAAADCDKAISERRSHLAQSYSSEVWNLKQRFQKDGDLGNALAADKEWSRSIRREPLTHKDLVESPKELRVLQDAFLDRFEKVDQQVATEVITTLQAEAAELARAGNLTDGRVLQQEIDKIKRLYLSDAITGFEKSSPGKGKNGLGRHGTEDPIAVCEEMIRQKRVALQAEYVGKLEALEKSFQATGALEDVFAAKAEKQRYLETPILARANIVEKPEALGDLQRKYREIHDTVARTTAEEFAARLEDRKKALTIDGKLEDAVQVSNDAKKIRHQYRLPEEVTEKNNPVQRALCKQKWLHICPGITFTYSFNPNGTYVLEGTARHGVYEISADDKKIILRWSTDNFTDSISVGNTLDDWRFGPFGDTAFKPIK